MALEPDRDAAELAAQKCPPEPAESFNSPLHDVTILVCSTCRNEQGSDVSPTPGELLFAATRAANIEAVNERSQREQLSIKVLSVECLGNCKRRLSASIVTSDCWTYVFGDLTLENAGDLVAGARLMSDTSNGLMPWRGRPQCLKSGMVARIPPLSR